jgi:hypothetical protein
MQGVTVGLNATVIESEDDRIRDKATGQSRTGILRKTDQSVTGFLSVHRQYSGFRAS